MLHLQISESHAAGKQAKQAHLLVLYKYDIDLAKYPPELYINILT